MAVQRVQVEDIADNPHQTRSEYRQDELVELAQSIKIHGLLQVPPGRRKGGQVEIAFGHKRLRAFRLLAAEDPEKYGAMPVDIRDMSDEQMAMFTLEENLRRSDITPLEVARSVDRFLTTFPDTKEKEVAELLSMTQGNVSNMRRVLRLPAKILEKIEQGKINFTMARELLVLEGHTGHMKEYDSGKRDYVWKEQSGEDMMWECVKEVTRQYGDSTVSGIQRAVYIAVRNAFPGLDEGCTGWSYGRPLFDRQGAGCLECPKRIRVHPTKTSSASFCTDPECWIRYQEVHKEGMRQEAAAAMKKDVLARVAAANISQEISQPVETEPATELGEKVEAQVREALEGPSAIPAEMEELVKEKAGTRAEVLDLFEGNVPQYTVLRLFELRLMDDPEECTERCTQGFHYAFDSSRPADGVVGVCTDPKCMGKKRATLTRKQNAQGAARKRAETAAIKMAVKETTSLDHGRMMVVIFVAVRNYDAREWLWGKVAPKTDGANRNDTVLLAAVGQLSDEELAKLIVELMLNMLRYQGDIESYEIRTTHALNLLGIGIDLPEEK